MKPHAHPESASRAELEFLKSTLGNKSEIADWLGLHRSTVSRWHRPHKPDLENEIKITFLRLVILRLSALFKEGALQKWLLGTNAFLCHQRPIDLIKQNRFAEVISAIEQEEAGGYA